MSVSVVIIALNEEKNIKACLEGVRWADEIVLVDSGSSDGTAQIARALGARVVDIVFTDFASQKNQAMEHARQDWILLLDADERVSEPLASEIQAVVRRAEKAAYRLGRLTYFFGGRLRFSGTQQDAPIRLFPRGRAKLVQPVHEEIETRLPVLKLREPLVHYSTRDFSHYRLKLDRYLPLEMRVLKSRNTPARYWDRYVRALGKFSSLYILQLGFLDGWAGLQYAGLSSYYVYRKYRLYYENRNGQNSGTI